MALPPMWQRLSGWSRAAVLVGLPTLAFISLLYALPWFVITTPRSVELTVEARSADREGQVHVRVTGPGEASASAEVVLPISLAAYASDGKDWLADLQKPEQVMDMGAHLFGLLFGEGKLRAIYEGTYARSRDFAGLLATRLRVPLADRLQERIRGTVVRLHVETDESLRDLPWEILYDPEIGQFLASAGGSSVTRAAQSAVPLFDWDTSRRIKVLVASASPDSLPSLDIEKEVSALIGALAVSGCVGVARLPHATPKRLIDTLRDGEFQILHYAGHATSEGLILEDDQGHEKVLEVLELAAAIVKPQLHMVFLNACETIDGKPQLGLPGLAAMLTAKGVPLVVGMQAPVYDKDALPFVCSFYRALVTTGSVDAAVRSGRGAVTSVRGGPAPPYWAIPVLFIRGANGNVLRPMPRWQQWFAERRWRSSSRSPASRPSSSSGYGTSHN